MLDFNDRSFCFYIACSNKMEDFTTLLSFYNEITEIAQKAGDKNAFQFKLQWFIDSLKNSKQKSGHPVIDNLFDLLKKYNIESKQMIPLVLSQVTLLDMLPFSKVSDIIDYAKNSSGLFWKTSALLLDENLNEDELKSIERVGIAFAIIGVIRNFTYNYSKNVYSLIFNESDLNNDFDTKLRINLESLVKEAENQINLSLKTKIKTNAKYLKLLNHFSRGYIRNIKKVNYDIFNANVTSISKYYYLIIIKDLILKRFFAF